MKEEGVADGAVKNTVEDVCECFALVIPGEENRVVSQVWRGWES